MRWLIMVLFAFASVAPAPARAFGFCSEPSEPSVPSGSYSDEYAMERAKRDVEEYLDDLQEYKQCLLMAAQQADDAAESIIAEWNRAVRNYNNQ